MTAALPRHAGLRVAVAREAGRAPVAAHRLAAVARAVLSAEGVRQAMLSITLLSPAAMARLNRRHLGHAGPTDVISFPFTGPGVVMGDIYVCPAVARAQAAAHGVGVRQELARLVVHGVLHVLGHEHPDGEARTGSPMWRRQERLVRRVTPLLRG